VDGASNIAAIACGAFHCLVLTSGGEVMAWGTNDYGQVWGQRNRCIGLVEQAALGGEPEVHWGVAGGAVESHVIACARAGRDAAASVRGAAG
jgi:hypothetical protein